MRAQGPQVLPLSLPRQVPVPLSSCLFQAVTMDAVLSGDTIWDICSDQPFIRNCHKDTEKRTRWVRGTENFYLIIRNHGENTENQLEERLKVVRVPSWLCSPHVILLSASFIDAGRDLGHFLPWLEIYWREQNVQKKTCF